MLDGKQIDLPPPGHVNVTFQRALGAEGERGAHVPSIWDSGMISDRVDVDGE